MKAARIVLMLTALVGLGTAGAWSVRLGWADYWYRKEAVEATEKAIEVMPEESEYQVQLALMVGDDDPARALAALRRAVALNPSDGRAWVEMGLRLEATRNFGAAEQAFRRAAEVDLTYLPRWTLMNYYFRRDNIDQFWFWAKAAVPMVYGDPLPLFHLCGRVSEDGELIDRLGIGKPQIQAGYLSYLLGVGRADLAGPASRRLLAENRKVDVPLLLYACDRLIEAHRVDDAVAIWEGLHRPLGVPSGTANGGGEPTVANGDFAVSPSGHGFDWRLPAADGISAAREEGTGGLRLTFSGMQAEQAEPLVQFVPVQENTVYELKSTYQTSGIEGRSGLSWQIADSIGKVNLAEGELVSSNNPVDGRLGFVTPPGCRTVRLSLVYRRQTGTTRISGYLVLRNVAARRAGASIISQ
jgi:hypothetical protein